MLHAWRITDAKHAATAFSGIGAELFGGRWNSPGFAVVYTSDSAPLAMLETLVHLDVADFLNDFIVFELTFSESLVSCIDPAMLPRNWRQLRPLQFTQQLGDNWAAAGTSAVLKLPSAVILTGWNYLLNPAHPDFAQIKIAPKKKRSSSIRALSNPPATENLV